MSKQDLGEDCILVNSTFKVWHGIRLCQDAGIPYPNVQNFLFLIWIEDEIAKVYKTYLVYFSLLNIIYIYVRGCKTLGIYAITANYTIK